MFLKSKMLFRCTPLCVHTRSVFISYFARSDDQDPYSRKANVFTTHRAAKGVIWTARASIIGGTTKISRGTASCYFWEPTWAFFGFFARRFKGLRFWTTRLGIFCKNKSFFTNWCVLSSSIDGVRGHNGSHGQEDNRFQQHETRSCNGGVRSRNNGKKEICRL